MVHVSLLISLCNVEAIRICRHLWRLFNVDICRRVQGARWRFETEAELLWSAGETGYGGRRDFVVHSSRAAFSASLEGEVVSSANLRRVRWPVAEVDEAVSVE